VRLHHGAGFREACSCIQPVMLGRPFLLERGASLRWVCSISATQVALGSDCILPLSYNTLGHSPRTAFSALSKVDISGVPLETTPLNERHYLSNSLTCGSSLISAAHGRKVSHFLSLSNMGRHRNSGLGRSSSDDYDRSAKFLVWAYGHQDILFLRPAYPKMVSTLLPKMIFNCS